MSDYDPGPGWRDEPLDTNVLGKRHLYEFDERAVAVKKWVWEGPAQPRPTVARATPIDRTELVRVIEEAFRVAGAIWGYDSDVIADRVLALIQLAQGIVLTPWQAAIAHEACRNSLSEFEGAWPEQHLARYRALADHLEAAALNT